MLRISTDEELHSAITGADPAAEATPPMLELDDRARSDLATIRSLPVEAARDTAKTARRHRPAVGRRPSKTRSILLVAAACSVAVAAGIGIAHLGSGVAPTREIAASRGAGLDAEHLLAALSGPPYAADCQPYDSTAAMAADSDLVVTGRIAGVRTGRTDADKRIADGVTTTSAVIEIKDAIAVQGELPSDGDGLLYVEMPVGREDALYPEDAARMLVGTPVAAYLQVAWSGELTEEFDNDLLDPDAGRPAGQPLYATIGPQALVLQASHGQLIWPALRSVQAGLLQQSLPGGTLIGGY